MKKAWKWVTFGLAVALNGFIIYHSFLPSEQSGSWSSFFSNIFENIINAIVPGKPAEHINVSNLSLSYTTSPINNVAGYVDNEEIHELPIGCTKLINAKILPENATDKSVSYEVIGDSVKVVQQGNQFSIVGKSLGSSIIKVLSNDNKEITDSFTFEVTSLKAPNDFTLSSETLDIVVGGGDIAPITIVNSDLTIKTYDSKVFLQRYYDAELLTIESNDDSIVEVKNILGIKNVLVGKSTGSTTVNISNNNGVSKTLIVNVGVAGTNNIYEDKNDLITYTDELDVAREDLDAGYKFDYENTIYSPLDETSLKTTEDGYVYGYRKFIDGDNSAFVRLIDKNDLTNYKDYEFTITDRTPTDFTVSISGATLKDGVYSIEQGKTISGRMSASPINAYHASYSVTSSVDDFVVITISGNSFNIQTNNYGDFLLTITCNENNELIKQFNISVIKRNAINEDNQDDFAMFIRKSLGHFSLFMIDGVISTLAIFFLWRDAKKWIIAISSIGFGVSMALLTELIQFLTSSWSHRAGSIYDSLIDAAGYIITMLIVFVIFVLIDKKKRNKSNSN